MFGGDSWAGFYNSLVTLDLDNITSQFNILSRTMETPSPRRGHAMEAYNDELYIFGGVDRYGDR